MSVGKLVAGVVAAAVSAAAAHAQAQLAAQGSPETFVRSLYARYADPNADAAGPQWEDSAVYTPALVALMRRDRELHEGELGFMDADWICQCQDYGGVRLRDVRVRDTGGGRADADVRFDFSEAGSERRIRLTLARTPGGWRVADVAPSEGEALVAGLRRSNAEAERARGRR